MTRLAALDWAESEFTRLLTDGLDRRILADPATALAAIQDALQAARDELLVLDPYFGHHAPDWSALKKVSVPVRVLTMHKQNATQATSKKPAQSPVLISAAPPADIQHLPGLTSVPGHGWHRGMTASTCGQAVAWRLAGLPPAWGSG